MGNLRGIGLPLASHRLGLRQLGASALQLSLEPPALLLRCLLPSCRCCIALQVGRAAHRGGLGWAAEVGHQLRGGTASGTNNHLHCRMAPSCTHLCSRRHVLLQPLQGLLAALQATAQMLHLHMGGGCTPCWRCRQEGRGWSSLRNVLCPQQPLQTCLNRAPASATAAHPPAPPAPRCGRSAAPCPSAAAGTWPWSPPPPAPASRAGAGHAGRRGSQVQAHRWRVNVNKKAQRPRCPPASRSAVPCCLQPASTGPGPPW